MNVGSVINHKIVVGVSLSFVMIKNYSQATGRLYSLKGYSVLLNFQAKSFPEIDLFCLQHSFIPAFFCCSFFPIIFRDRNNFKLLFEETLKTTWAFR